MPLQKSFRAAPWPLAALLFLACKPAPTEKAASPAAVQIAVAASADVPIELSAFGIVESNNEILPQVTGLVTEVRFREGDSVKKGDLLFTIDTRVYSASLSAARASLLQSQATFEQARVEQDRYRSLRDAQVASDQELLQAEANAAKSAAALQLAQAQAQSASLNVAFTRVVAPQDGRTGSLLVYPGSFVQPGNTTPMVVIRSVSPIQVRFAVPESYLPQIREKMALGPLTVRVRPRGSQQAPTEGRLTFLENAIDAATGTLSLKAEFENADAALWPGAAVDVRLALAVDKAVVVVPEAAVQEGQQGTYAFVVGQNNNAELRKLTVGYTSERQAVVRAGLAVGERVVVDGQVRLRDGARVSVMASEAPRPGHDGSGAAEPAGILIP